MSGLWAGTTGDALPNPLPVLIGPGNGLVTGAGRLGASEESSIGGNGREVGTAVGRDVKELDAPGGGTTVSEPPLPAACHCREPPPIWAPNWKWGLMAGAACGSPGAGPHLSRSVVMTV